MSKLSELQNKTTPVNADLITWLDSEDTNPDTKNKNFSLSSLWSAIFGTRTSDDVPEWTTNKYASTANVDAAWATMNTDTNLTWNGWFLDEDDMVSNDASKTASQQSIRTFVLNQWTNINWLSEDTLPDMDVDYNIEYDVSGLTNKKYKMSSYRASDSEAAAWTSTTKFTTPKNLKDNYWLNWVATVTLDFTASATTLSVAHGLSKIPTKLRFDAVVWDNFWVYWNDNWTEEQSCSYSTASATWARAWLQTWQIAAYNQTGTDYARRAVTSVDATNINLTRVWLWNVWTTNVVYIITCSK